MCQVLQSQSWCLSTLFNFNDCDLQVCITINCRGDFLYELMNDFIQIIIIYIFFNYFSKHYHVDMMGIFNQDCLIFLHIDFPPYCLSHEMPLKIYITNISSQMLCIIGLLGFGSKSKFFFWKHQPHETVWKNLALKLRKHIKLSSLITTTSSNFQNPRHLSKGRFVVVVLDFFWLTFHPSIKIYHYY